MLCKRVRIDKTSVQLRDEFLYFFYITNYLTTPTYQIVFQTNYRRDQENLISQLEPVSTADSARKRPLEQLRSHRDIVVIFEPEIVKLLLAPATNPDTDNHQAEKLTLLLIEFSTYLAAFIEMPCHIIRRARLFIYPLLSSHPSQDMFLLFVERLQSCSSCCESDHLKSSSSYPHLYAPSRVETPSAIVRHVRRRETHVETSSP